LSFHTFIKVFPQGISLPLSVPSTCGHKGIFLPLSVPPTCGHNIWIYIWVFPSPSLYLQRADIVQEGVRLGFVNQVHGADIGALHKGDQRLQLGSGFEEELQAHGRDRWLGEE